MRTEQIETPHGIATIVYDDAGKVVGVRCPIPKALQATVAAKIEAYRDLRKRRN